MSPITRRKPFKNSLTFVISWEGASKGRSTYNMPSSYLAFLISITALTLIQIFPGALAMLEVPLFGDVSLCRPEYGRSLKEQDCMAALRRMPLSDKFGTYTNARDLSGRIKSVVPLTYESGKFLFNASVIFASPPMGAVIKARATPPACFVSVCFSSHHMYAVRC